VTLGSAVILISGPSAEEGRTEIRIKVRFVKLCAPGGESPLSLAVEPLEFEAKAENGKV